MRRPCSKRIALGYMSMLEGRPGVRVDHRMSGHSHGCHGEVKENRVMEEGKEMVYKILGLLPEGYFAQALQLSSLDLELDPT